LGIERTNLVGNDSGGAISQIFPRLHRHRLSRGAGTQFAAAWAAHGFGPASNPALVRTAARWRSHTVSRALPGALSLGGAASVHL
jgi:hypothetical protein